jgi:hypothetical protein
MTIIGSDITLQVKEYDEVLEPYRDRPGLGRHGSCGIPSCR